MGFLTSCYFSIATVDINKIPVVNLSTSNSIRSLLSPADMKRYGHSVLFVSYFNRNNIIEYQMDFNVPMINNSPIEHAFFINHAQNRLS